MNIYLQNMFLAFQILPAQLAAAIFSFSCLDSV